MAILKHPAVMAALVTVGVLLVAKNVDMANKFLFKQ